MKKEEAIKIITALPTGLHEQTDADKKNIRAIVEEFNVGGVNLRGRCPSCWQDAVLVLRNFFGISTGETDGDGKPDTGSKKWKYLRTSSMKWRGIIIDQCTPDEVIDEFVKYHPHFYKLQNTATAAEDGSGKGEEVTE